MKVLLSIKPEFAEKIFSGEKTFEFRKSVFKNSTVKTVVVYATRPVARIVGEFDVARVMGAEPSELWKKTQAGAGITEEFFREYFVGRSYGFALEIENATLYPEPIMPSDLIENFVAPQSYMYVDDAGGRKGSEQLALLV